jgi:rhodanese-related sulfurtransferase
MRITSTAAAGLLASLFALPAISADLQDIPENKRTKAGLYLTSVEADGLLQDDNILLLDVRSRPEVNFVGMPERVDVHIPLMVMPEEASYDTAKGGYALEPNNSFEFDFLDYAEARNLPDDNPIVIICRSGSRSAKAADLLYDLGFTQVYSIVDGFEGDIAKDGPERGHRAVNGWKNAGLTWSYAISPGQAYPRDY